MLTMHPECVDADYAPGMGSPSVLVPPQVGTPAFHTSVNSRLITNSIFCRLELQHLCREPDSAGSHWSLGDAEMVSRLPELLA